RGARETRIVESPPASRSVRGERGRAFAAFRSVASILATGWLNQLEVFAMQGRRDLVVALAAVLFVGCKTTNGIRQSELRTAAAPQTISVADPAFAGTLWKVADKHMKLVASQEGVAPPASADPLREIKEQSSAGWSVTCSKTKCDFKLPSS